MAGRSKMIDRHLKALQGLEGRKVEAGWFESDRYPAGGEKKENKKKAGNSEGNVGMQVAVIARILEFGATINRISENGKSYQIIIPPRGFMRYAWSNFSKSRQDIQVKIGKNLISGKINADQALGQIGLAIEGHIARSIRNGPWAANSPYTVKVKGFDKPLIDTGHMWKSVSSKVS